MQFKRILSVILVTIMLSNTSYVFADLVLRKRIQPSQETFQEEVSNSNTQNQQNDSLQKTLLGGEPKSVACSLIENQNKDIVQALDDLSLALKEISKAEECKDDTDIQEMIAKQKEMQASASNVMSIWEDKDNMSENLGGFSSEITGLLHGVDTITKSLNNNSLVNSKCSEKILTTGKLLVAVSDLVTSMAPFAMFIAVNSKMSVAVPWVIGVVGVASVIKFIGDRAKNNDSLEMDKNPEHQKLVLKATCEFSKIATKVRFLKLAQAGKLDEISNSLNKSENFQPMANQMSQELQKLIKQRNLFYDKLNQIRNNFERQKASLAEVKNTITDHSSNTFVCSLGKQLGDQYNKKKFPYDVFQTMESINQMGNTSSDIVGDSSDELKKAFAIGITSTLKKQLTSEKMEECAAATKELIGSIEDALIFTNKEIKVQKKLQEEKLSVNQEYKIWYEQNKDLEEDKQVVNKISQVMKSATETKNAIEQSNISERLEELRSVLFGNADADEGLWSLVYPNEPPIYLWLKYTLDLYDTNIKSFNSAYENLHKKTADLYVGRGNGKYSDLRPQSVIAYFLKKYEYNKEKNSSVMRGVESLSYINNKSFPAGTEERAEVCNYLETLWLDYSTSMNHFDSVKAFCGSITEYINYKTSKSIVEICGEKPLSKNPDTNSKIYQFERGMALAGLKNKKEVLSLKMDELSCLRGIH